MANTTEMNIPSKNDIKAAFLQLETSQHVLNQVHTCLQACKDNPDTTFQISNREIASMVIHTIKNLPSYNARDISYTGLGPARISVWKR